MSSSRCVVVHLFRHGIAGCPSVDSAVISSIKLRETELRDLSDEEKNHSYKGSFFLPLSGTSPTQLSTLHELISDRICAYAKCRSAGGSSSNVTKKGLTCVVRVVALMGVSRAERGRGRGRRTMASISRVMLPCDAASTFPCDINELLCVFHADFHDLFQSEDEDVVPQHHEQRLIRTVVQPELGSPDIVSSKVTARLAPFFPSHDGEVPHEVRLSELRFETVQQLSAMIERLATDKDRENRPMHVRRVIDCRHPSGAQIAVLPGDCLSAVEPYVSQFQFELEQMPQPHIFRSLGSDFESSSVSARVGGDELGGLDDSAERFSSTSAHGGVDDDWMHEAEDFSHKDELSEGSDSTPAPHHTSSLRTLERVMMSPAKIREKQEEFEISQRDMFTQKSTVFTQPPLDDDDDDDNDDDDETSSTTTTTSDADDETTATE